MFEFRKLKREDEAAFLDYYNEWPVPDEMVPFSTNFSRYDHFEQLLEGLNHQESWDDWVKNSTYFYFDNGRIVGAGNIRHYLNDALLETGGHIGYGVRPSARNKGYASAILQHSLQYLETLGVDKALLTCDADNPASANVILKNRGIEAEPFIQTDGTKVRRFWIHI